MIQRLISVVDSTFVVRCPFAPGPIQRSYVGNFLPFHLCTVRTRCSVRHVVMVQWLFEEVWSSFQVILLPRCSSEDQRVSTAFCCCGVHLRIIVFHRYCGVRSLPVIQYLMSFISSDMNVRVQIIFRSKE